LKFISHNWGKARKLLCSLAVARKEGWGFWFGVA
jgi:hypothetical protein